VLTVCSQYNNTENCAATNRGSACWIIRILCQHTWPKRWLISVNKASHCDVTNSEHPATMTTIRNYSIYSAKIYFSSVLITSRFRVLILGKLFVNNIYALFICKSQDKMIMTSFSLFYCSKCRALGTSSCSLNISDGSRIQHGAKLGSDGSSDDWWLLDGGRLTHILLDTHQKWGTLVTLLLISIYSIFGLMWFATS